MKHPLRVLFMGTPDFAVPALVALQDRHSIVAVYTQPDRPVGRGLQLKASPVKEKALEFGLPVHQPEKLSQPGEFERLQALAPDIIVVVAYGQILRQNVLDLPRLGCVNIHSSLLPRWRGAAPIQWAILAGDKDSGITTMRMVRQLDAGNILLQEKTPIGDADDAQALHDRLAAMGARLIVDTLEGLAEGKLGDRPQDADAVTYAEKLTKEMERLDFRKPARELWNQIRALNPWPGTRVQLATGEGLKIRAAHPRLDIPGRPGEVFTRAGMLLLGTAQGSLELKTLQWDGKKAMDTASFVNGLRGKDLALPFQLQDPFAPERTSS